MIAARNPFKRVLGLLIHGGEVVTNLAFGTKINRHVARRLLMGNPNILTLTQSRDEKYNRP